MQGYILTNMKRLCLLAVALFLSVIASAQDIGRADTVFFRYNKPFEWHVTPRYDYSSTLVGKLFLSQALFDGRYKQKDNGRSELFMTVEEAARTIAAMDAISLGMPKIIYLVGWQYNGHDSKYPALFEGNKTVMRPSDSNPLQSLAWLMEEGGRHHTAVSLHINLFDCFEDSPLFDEYVSNDLLARNEDGSYKKGDWGYKISYAQEWHKGFLKKRIDSLCTLLPVEKVGTIHVDAYHNSVPTPYQDENGNWNIRMVAPIDPFHGFSNFDDIDAQRAIIKYFDSKGIDVTNEGYPTGQWENVFEGYVPMVWHYPGSMYMRLQADELCGGDSSTPLGPLFGQCSSMETIFRDTTITLNQRLDKFKEAFCLSYAQWYFLNRFDRVMMLKGENATYKAVFTDNVCSLYQNGEVSIWKDGALLAKGTNEFLPALWIDGKVMIAYSREGYSKMEWTLPSDYPENCSVKLYEVTSSGEIPCGQAKVKNSRVTLSMKPGQMIKVVF